MRQNNSPLKGNRTRERFFLDRALCLVFLDHKIWTLVSLALSAAPKAIAAMAHQLTRIARTKFAVALPGIAMEF
jgi:hypothetical protein